MDQTKADAKFRRWGREVEGDGEQTLALLTLSSNRSEWVFGKMERSTGAERNITFTLLYSEQGERLMFGPLLSEPMMEPMMQTAVFPDPTASANEHVLRTLQLNKDHQGAVKTKIEQLEDDLANLNKLLVRADSQARCRELTKGTRLLQRSTTKTSSNLKSAGIYPSPGLQRSQLQSLPKNSFPRWVAPFLRCEGLVEFRVRVIALSILHG